MWIMTPIGFFSAVQKKADREGNFLTIRARDKSDLERLIVAHLPGARITTSKGTDYPYRIRVRSEDWADAVREMAVSIDYANFKDEVKKKQGQKRASVYGRIWGVLLDLEPRRLTERWGGGRGYGGGGNVSLFRDDFARADDPCGDCNGTGGGGDASDGRGVCLSCGGTGLDW